MAYFKIVYALWFFWNDIIGFVYFSFIIIIICFYVWINWIFAFLIVYIVPVLLLNILFFFFFPGSLTLLIVRPTRCDI